jgi:outer membrane autotransporter protein
MDFLGNDRFLGGVHVGYARTHLSLDDDLGGGNADNYFASAYGTWLGKSGYLEGTLAYSRHQYDNRRKIEIGNIESTARSEHAGNAVSAQLGTGTVCPAGPWQLRPRASLLYTYLDQSGFTESGADSLNLHVEGHGAHSLKSELGMEIARPFRFGENLLVPEVGVAWEHDFGIDDRAITSSFEGLPGNTFTVARDNVEADSTRLHAGIVLVHGNRFLTALNFDAILHQNHTAHAVSGELRIAF